MRRAGDVGEDTAGLEREQGRVDQAGLQSGQVGDVLGLLAPTRLRPAAQGAQPGARRVEQNTVEGVWMRLSDGLTIDFPHGNRLGQRSEGGAHEGRPSGHELVRHEVGSSGACFGGE